MDSIFAGEAIHNIVKDELGENVRSIFSDFLVEYGREAPESQDSQAMSDGPTPPDRQAKYIQQIRQMREDDKTTLYVNFKDVIDYDSELGEAIETQAYRLDPFLRRALQDVVQKVFPNSAVDSDKRDTLDREFYIAFYDHSAIYKIRELRSNKIGRLCSIRGTVTRTSEVRPELLYGSFRCLDCASMIADVEQQFRYTEPTVCKNPTCQNRNRWQLDVEGSKFIDWQKVRVQENSDEIPSGSMPRSLEIILRNEQVEKSKAGDKCIFTGTLIVVPDISKGRAPGPRAQGISRQNGRPKGQEGSKELANSSTKDYSYKMCFLASCVMTDSKFGANSGDEEDETLEQFTPEELEDLQKMKNSSKIYNQLIASIAPAVFGHRDVKKGILLMLFGGVHKVTIEGINLRGDINVCIVGDPSTSKSQFLKYVVSFLPRAVYTSGKASSAAGLTATVVKDPDSGEFNIEAGALMLADNGICCIDEFDKMDQRDQVAIHEAMEQQTISIAKAGIQATLNARTSILAAANPIGGRYDKSKTLKANLNITPPIMSRFDLFFVVLDECDETTDYNIAKHIVEIHQRKDKALKPEYSTLQLQKYIRYARTFKPTITPEAAKLLVENYRKLRQSDIVGHNKTAYRITVRQLESMIRLSEALARIHCDSLIRPEYVTEAAQLLRKSIIHVETGDVVFEVSRPIEPEPDDDSDDDQMQIEATKPKEPEKKAEKQRLAVTYVKFEQIVGMILHHVKEAPEGETQVNVIRWYLKQKEDEFTSEEELEAERLLVEHVVNRLVTTERHLHVLQEAPEGKDESERVLIVNPNLDEF